MFFNSQSATQEMFRTIEKSNYNSLPLSFHSVLLIVVAHISKYSFPCYVTWKGTKRSLAVFVVFADVFALTETKNMF